jgi:UDPglucose--hexose-1-phosphate uridylyltransferase
VTLRDFIPSQILTRSSFRRYVSIIPRVTRLAGFELGSGMSINAVPSETAAEFLRNVQTVKSHGAG